MAADNVPIQSVPYMEGPFQVDPVPLLQGTDGGPPGGFRHHIHGEALAVKLRHRQAGPVAADAFPDFQQGRNGLGGNGEPVGILFPAHVLHLAQFRNKSRKHGLSSFPTGP